MLYWFDPEGSFPTGALLSAMSLKQLYLFYINNELHDYLYGKGVACSDKHIQNNHSAL